MIVLDQECFTQYLHCKLFLLRIIYQGRFENLSEGALPKDVDNIERLVSEFNIFLQGLKLSSIFTFLLRQPLLIRFS